MRPTPPPSARTHGTKKSAGACVCAFLYSSRQVSEFQEISRRFCVNLVRFKAILFCTFKQKIKNLFLLTNVYLEQIQDFIVELRVKSKSVTGLQFTLRKLSL